MIASAGRPDAAGELFRGYAAYRHAVPPGGFNQRIDARALPGRQEGAPSVPQRLGRPVGAGEVIFLHMPIINDGPFTLIIESPR